MDPTKLIIEHPFSIEERFKKADLEKMMATENAPCTCSVNFAYQEGGAYYGILCRRSSYSIKNSGNANGIFKLIMVELYVNFGNVGKIKAKYRISVPSINFSYEFECFFGASTFTGLGPGLPEKKMAQPGFYVNDELLVKIDGTLIFERPLISTSSFPINIQWNIKESELKAKAATNDYLMTSEFKISPNSSANFCLVIHPNRGNDETRGKVVTYLQLELGNGEKIEAIYSFSTKNFSINDFFLYEKDKACGPTICSTDDLFRPSIHLFVNGEMTLKFKANLIFKKEEPSLKLSGISIKRIKNEKDFKLVVDGKEIQVHKVLLIEKSQYFALEFNSKSKESTKNQIIISDFSFKTVDSAIKLLYGNSSSFCLPDLIPLLYFSDKYIINDIKVLVEKYLIKNILESNVCQLIHFSTIFHAPKLHQKSLQFLVQCLRKFSPVNDLDLLDKDVYFQLLSKALFTNCD